MRLSSSSVAVRCLTVLLLAGCGDPMGSDGGIAMDAARTDGAAVDGASLDGATLDDAGADAEPSCSGVVTLLDLGHCFDARRCCVAADCGTDRAWECTVDGLCVSLDRTCGCADDLDCTADAFCFTNAVVCGVCMPARPSCISDTDCTPGRCSLGYCVDGTMCLDYPEP